MADLACNASGQALFLKKAKQIRGVKYLERRRFYGQIFGDGLTVDKFTSMGASRADHIVRFLRQQSKRSPKDRG